MCAIFHVISWRLSHCYFWPPSLPLPLYFFLSVHGQWNDLTSQVFQNGRSVARTRESWGSSIRQGVYVLLRGVLTISRFLHLISYCDEHE